MVPRTDQPREGLDWMPMSDFDVLLALQDRDIAADQRRHHRETLPERGELAELDRSVAALDEEAASVAAERAEWVSEQKRLEDEAALVSDKAARESSRLYSGEVTAAKELQAIQEEIAALKRRQEVLEERILELMELVDPLDERLAELASRREDLEGRRSTVRDRLADAEAAIDQELEGILAEREELAVKLPGELLAEYEQLRRALGGIGVARLEGGACRGCHLQLSAVELDRIRKLPAETLVHCEECGRILVR